MSSSHLVPVAATQLGALVLALIQLSPFPIPKLRKDALCESFRVATSEEELKDIFLDAVCGSPYIDTGMKQDLANVALGGDWETLLRLIGIHEHFVPQYTTTAEAILSEFKYLATRIFIKSRAMRALPLLRRQNLGKALLECQTKEAVMELVLVSLEESQILSVPARMRIANDVFEGKFYRLLLADRFDCDVIPRLEVLEHCQEEDREDCVICLDAFPNGEYCTLATCGHSFCQPCIENLSNQHNGSSFPCPMCRTECSMEQTLRKIRAET
jgi:hypothetical protein